LLEEAEAYIKQYSEKIANVRQKIEEAERQFEQEWNKLEPERSESMISDAAMEYTLQKQELDSLIDLRKIFEGLKEEAELGIAAQEQQMGEGNL
jgi:acyl-CoA reductase-like NAD-dependent aldehyde dehydrogenase